MPRLLLQTSRREGCPGKSINAQHSAFNFLPHGQSPAVSPVMSDLIEGTASWSRSAKLVASFAFPYHVTPKPFQTP